MSIVAAILVAWVMKGIIKSKAKGYFIMELPVYRMPRWNNVGITMFESVKTFVTQAGKVIIAVSIVLWVLASYGPGNRFEKIDNKYNSSILKQKFSVIEVNRLKASEKLESSYAGVLGKSIEPAIKPLGFDWKIGIDYLFCRKGSFCRYYGHFVFCRWRCYQNGICKRKNGKCKKHTNWLTGIYSCFSIFFNDVLCICYAMYEHYGSSLSRNKKHQMAIDTVCLHVSFGLCCQFYCLSTIEVK
jgi:hypothetical protein